MGNLIALTHVKFFCVFYCIQCVTVYNKKSDFFTLVLRFCGTERVDYTRFGGVSLFSHNGLLRFC